MNKKIWDLYAPIYNKAMQADQKHYSYMYSRIPAQIGGKEFPEDYPGFRLNFTTELMLF